METKTKQVSGVLNQVEYRRAWIERIILSRQSELKQLGCLDLGAGKKPYQELIRNSDIQYTSHDFAKYSPNKHESGLQDNNWPEDGYDIVCDILEVKASNFDLVLLTEVLEHVLHPSEVLKVALSCIRPKGYVLITVPFNSRMHQAPYWYASGLSEFYFKSIGQEIGFECIEIIQVGDFVDYWIQESTICLSPFPRLQKFGTKLILKIGKLLRKNLDSQLLSSGGLNLLVLLQKK